MTKLRDPFADESYGQVALQKLHPVDPNFRFTKAGYIGSSNERDIMRLVGVVYREAVRGPNKGVACIPVKGTTREVFVTRDEIDRFEAMATSAH